MSKPTPELEESALRVIRYLYRTCTLGLHPPVRWDRANDVAVTSLGVTGCRKEIAIVSQECREMSRECRDVVAWRARSLEFTKRQQLRRLRSTLRHYNRIPPDWGSGITSRASVRNRKLKRLVRAGFLGFRPSFVAPESKVSWLACYSDGDRRPKLAARSSMGNSASVAEGARKQGNGMRACSKLRP